MIKKEFQQVFQSYFHNKYTFSNFLYTRLIESINFTFYNFGNYLLLSYIKNKQTNKLTPKSKELKEYHIFLNNILFKNMHINRYVFSYIENKSVYDAVYLHKDSTSYFKTDIKNFFGSIDKELVLQCLQKNIEQYPVSLELENNFKNIIDLVVYNNTLPIGFTTSPSISNAILYDFDNIIEKYCHENEIIYTRYSDDLIFSANNYKVLQNLQNIITKNLNELYDGKFILNQEKTQFLDKTDKLNILGLIITPQGHITVSRHIKDNIKQLLYFYMNDKDKFNDFLEKRYKNSIIRAYGSLNYINNIDKSFISKLRKKYGNFVIDKFLHGDKSI